MSVRIAEGVDDTLRCNSDRKEGREGHAGRGVGEGAREGCGGLWRGGARLTCLCLWCKAGGRRCHAGACFAGWTGEGGDVANDGQCGRSDGWRFV